MSAALAAGAFAPGAVAPGLAAVVAAPEPAGVLDFPEVPQALPDVPLPDAAGASLEPEPEDAAGAAEEGLLVLGDLLVPHDFDGLAELPLLVLGRLVLGRLALGRLEPKLPPERAAYPAGDNKLAAHTTASRRINFLNSIMFFSRTNL